MTLRNVNNCDISKNYLFPLTAVHSQGGTAVKRALLSLMILTIFATPALANVRVEKKLMQFGGPETRTRCIGELKTKGLPNCKIKGFEVRCEDTWIKTCIEWATDFKQHEIFLIASGPDSPDAALKDYLQQSLETALAAALAAAVATPGEVAAKAAAAVAAFKTALYASLAVKPVLNSLKDKYSVSLEERSHW